MYLLHIPEAEILLSQFLKPKVHVKKNKGRRNTAEYMVQIESDRTVLLLFCKITETDSFK